MPKKNRCYDRKTVLAYFHWAIDENHNRRSIIKLHNCDTQEFNFLMYYMNKLRREDEDNWCELIYTLANPSDMDIMLYNIPIE